MSGAASSELTLPGWSRVSERRQGHIERVTALLLAWADAMGLDEAARAAWRDAGLWHDAIKDAPEAELRALAPDPMWPAAVVHAPAAAALLEREGERRTELLEAIRWHPLGHPRWTRTGRALYMADFLEPGRKFSRADRAFLAGKVPEDFDGVFRQVVRMRLEHALREGYALYHETVQLWNAVR